MKLPPPCMIHVIITPLQKQVLKLAKLAGYDTHLAETSSHHYPALVFGKWWEYSREESCLTGVWDNSLWNRHPDWIRFDATTEMDKIESHFRMEPEFDESPLPFTMDKKLVEQTRKKFNLSPEQWEDMTPMVRDALAGTKVEVTVVKGNHKWVSVKDALPNGSYSVLVTNNPRVAEDSVDYTSTAYYSSGWMSMVRRFTPTHWCAFPDSKTKGIPVDDSEEDSEPQMDEDI